MASVSSSVLSGVPVISACSVAPSKNTVTALPVTSAQPVEFGSWPGWYAGVIELVAGLLIATGLFTRAVAFVASGEMAVAYFWMHQPYALWPIGGPPDGNGGTPAILFCFGFFLLVFTGGGIYSIDARRTVTA